MAFASSYGKLLQIAPLSLTLALWFSQKTFSPDFVYLISFLLHLIYRKSRVRRLIPLVLQLVVWSKVEFVLLYRLWHGRPSPSWLSVMFFHLAVPPLPSTRMVGNSADYCSLLAAPCHTVLYEFY